jgi:vacuolar-type H+-ATPase subunit I/STV1
VRVRIIIAVAAFAVGVVAGVAAGRIFNGKLLIGTSGEARQIDREIAIAKQEADRTISDLVGTVEQLDGAVGRLEESLRFERERVAALEEYQRDSKRVYQQLIEADGRADEDFREAIEIIESLLVQE